MFQRPGPATVTVRVLETSHIARYCTCMYSVVCVVTAAAAEVYFYDAVENVEDLASVCDDDEDEMQRQTADPRLRRLQSRLVSICQRKANVRNRKVCHFVLYF